MASSDLTHLPGRSVQISLRVSDASLIDPELPAAGKGEEAEGVELGRVPRGPLAAPPAGRTPGGSARSWGARDKGARNRCAPHKGARNRCAQGRECHPRPEAVADAPDP